MKKWERVVQVAAIRVLEVQGLSIDDTRTLRDMVFGDIWTGEFCDEVTEYLFNNLCKIWTVFGFFGVRKKRLGFV